MKKKLIYWVCVLVGMSAILGMINLAIKQVYDDSTLDKCVLVLVHFLWFIITYNMFMFKYKWTKKLIGKDKE